MKSFKIRGRIVDKDSGRGVPNLIVKAFDKDLLYDDLLGEVDTDEQGYFEIVYDKRDFRELFFDNQPDLYLKVRTSNDEEVMTTEDRVRYGSTNTEEFEIAIAAKDFIPNLPAFELKVTRPEDFLFIHFKFINLKIAEHQLIPLNPNRASYIIAEFPPQNIAEEAFFEVAEHFPVEDTDSPTPVQDSNTGDEEPELVSKSRLSEPSRLVFKVPKEDKIPYSVEGLLNAIRNYELNLIPTAYPPLIYMYSQVKAELLVKRVSVLQNYTFETLQLSVSTEAAAVQTDDLSPTSKTKASEWIDRSSLKKYLPQSYDYTVRNDIASAFFKTKPKLRPPSEIETSIEAPYRLLISPNKYAAWVHATKPVVSSSNRTELWHTRCALRLKGKIIEENNRLKTVRAIWTRDPGFDKIVEDNTAPHIDIHYDASSPSFLNQILNPFRMSLDAYDRASLVYLTANQYFTGFTPTPVDVKQLMLSSFGAWMNVHGAWTPPNNLSSVEEWRHRGTMGRDHYVRVVYKGYLCPFGHRASLVKITERKFHPQVLYILDFAGYQFRGKVSAFAKNFDSTSQLTAKRFMQDINENYDRNVADLCQSLQTQSETERTQLVKEAQAKFRTETLSLINASNQKTKNLLTAFASHAEKEFELSIGHIADAVDVVAAQTVPGNIAFLRQRMYIVVREPERLYIDSGFKNYNLQMPFSRVEITTLVTPDLDEPSTSEVIIEPEGPNKGQSFFWPSVGGNKFQFHMTAEDFAGTKLDFIAPLIFTESTLLSNFDDAKAILEKGSNECRAFIQPDFAGQFVMFADSSSAPGKTTLETKDITFDMELLDSETDHSTLRSSINDPEFPQFYPKIHQANVLIPSIKHLAGNNELATIEYYEPFLTKGFNSTTNKGEIFAKLVNNIDLDFNSQGDRSGGLAKPNMSINGLSRLMGPVAGNNLSDLELGTFDPKDFFGALDAKIFGVINLWDIIKKLDPNNFLGGGGKQIPKLLPDISKDKIDVGFKYSPPLKDWKNIFIASNKGKKAELEISAMLTAHSSGDADMNIYCGMRNFSIDLIGSLESFIVVHFNQIAFTTSGGQKAEVDVDLGEIEFVGVLSFVEALKDFIPLDGFSDPPNLEVSAQGITANFSLSLPTIAVGMFSLQNMSLGASFNLPFLIDPLSVRFNFSERESPFLLTVSLFGGGGFFAITIDPSGVQRLEASFEFGASVSIDLGVASGGVQIMAGIYFMMETDPERAELTGYFRLAGEVDVLGIISASIELYLVLSYEFNSGKCTGRATLTIEIEVFIFSGSVEISCERKFAGSNGDPLFKELMGPYIDPVLNEEIKPWEIYCQAYA